MTVDIAIIGAGPAGGMAAMRLAGTGLKVAVLEKERVPRSKACGGAISTATFERLQQWFSPTVAARAHKVRLTHNYATPVIEKELTRPIILLDRSRFDHQLIEAALVKGGKDIAFRDSWPVERIEETESGLRLHGPNNQSIHARYLIGADGANSLAARFLGLTHRAGTGYAIAASITLTGGRMENFRSTVSFNYHCIPSGYGWIFPRRDRLICGIGSWRKPFPTRGDMNGFLQRSLPDGSIRSVQMQTHPVPVWTGFRRMASHRGCLAGDAAGLVHPITGEGIRFALISGMLAAETILSLTDGAADRNHATRPNRAKGPGCRTYQKRIHQTIGNELEMLRLFALPLFLEAPDLFYRKFILEGRDVANACRNLAAKTSPRMVEPISPRVDSWYGSK